LPVHWRGGQKMEGIFPMVMGKLGIRGDNDTWPSIE
jgi:hypothetical protein